MERTDDIERKIYDLLDNKLAEFFHEEIIEDEFAEVWDDYLARIGARWISKSTTPSVSDSEGILIYDPLYTRGGHIFLSNNLINKIMVLGLP